MMTQIRKQLQARRRPSPRQAAASRGAIDRLLDPALFKALCDPTRASLIACLAKCGRMCSVSEVAACCSMDFSVVSRHLSMLAAAGVLEARKDGRTMFYQVRYSGLCESLRALADAFEDCCPGDMQGAGKGGCCGAC